MNIVFLGTGTSVGIPVIGCDCPVCTSVDPRNKRLRTGLYVQADGHHIVVDTPPDFREQALAYRIPRVDAVLFTHSHADHIFGLDDMRRYNTMQNAVIPAYGNAETLADLRRIFDYVHGAQPTPGVYRPRIDFCDMPESLGIGPLRVTPLPVVHGPKPTLGFLFEHNGCRVGYVPDCHDMPEPVLEQLVGVDVMILDALRHRPHITHLTVEQSVALLTRIQPKRAFLVHMCHDLDHEETEAALPSGVRLSYDGLTVECAGSSDAP